MALKVGKLNFARSAIWSRESPRNGAYQDEVVKQSESHGDTKRRNSDDCFFDRIKLNYHNRFILKLLRYYFILGVV